jgi:hypothetical protein
VSEAPTTNLQTGQQAAGVLPNAVEKLHSTQAALEDQDVTDWLPTVEKLSMALKERAVAARASAWAKTVEKLRSRQMALKERAVPVRTVVDQGEIGLSKKQQLTELLCKADARGGCGG